tara:strand:- start:21 stop:149 length:129 start_codon:yes stop_codon:yes gene_type:complete
VDKSAKEQPKEFGRSENVKGEYLTVGVIEKPEKLRADSLRLT